MSLNDAQRRRTAEEFAQNLARSGLSEARLMERCQLPPHRFDAALAVGPDADPVDVWRIRDTLETAVVEAGAAPVGYSVLTERMRAAAGIWFGVRDRR